MDEQMIKTLYFGYACYSCAVSGSLELTLKEEMDKRTVMQKIIKSAFDVSDFEEDFKENLSDMPHYKFRFFLNEAEAKDWAYFESLRIE